MRRLIKITLWILTPILCVVVLYKANYPTYSHRYRLTLAIEVDGQVHTGSSVVEVRCKRQPPFPFENPEYAVQVHGQGALVDLGSRGVVFGALHPGYVQNKSVHAAYLALLAYGFDSKMIACGFESSKYYRAVADQKGRRDLPRLPLFIWFLNIADLNTARVITPADIPRLFGDSARLKEASVEITQQSVVIDIDKKLPWYKVLAEQQKRQQRREWVRGNPFQVTYDMFAAEN